ncbi:MAG: SRPBCC domain-containing protein [Flavobacteriales bacterium]
MQRTKIRITAIIAAEPSKVGEYWTKPAHIVNWNFASEDWHCPAAENDLVTGGKFKCTMASKNGKMSFNSEFMKTSSLRKK